MIYTLSNEADSLFEENKVRLSIDVEHEVAVEILAAAKKIVADRKAAEEKRQNDEIHRLIFGTNPIFPKRPWDYYSTLYNR